MKPLFYSDKLTKKTGQGWFRDGINIEYFLNSIKKDEGNGNCSTLSFELIFNHDTTDDSIYVANNYPYTYTDLINFLDNEVCTEATQNMVRRTSLC